MNLVRFRSFLGLMFVPFLRLISLFYFLSLKESSCGVGRLCSEQSVVREFFPCVLMFSHSSFSDVKSPA